MTRLALPLAALALSLLTPELARACGGTFCDNAPVPMPVDQRGEDILFVQDGPEIEVHVRIEYEGAAERFAWLVPIQSVPEISVGSEPLFVRLAAATVPLWTTQSECPDTSGPIGFVPVDDAGPGEDPEVLLQTTVGAFEVVVLQGGTAAEVINFLDANGYAQDPEAEPILQDYLDEGFLFAAVKLTADASVDSIHPLVFRFQGDEPCVPIRLTRIAAEQDMGIRVYFLGKERWAPLNYQHVVLNPLAFPWSEVTPQSSLLDYTELLTLAVDEAGGRAFATDYAGTSEAVATWDIYRTQWNEDAFVGLDMGETITQIFVQDLFSHSLLTPLLLEFMPIPDDFDFNDNPWNYWANIDQLATRDQWEAWDSQAFAAALGERIIDPGLHAVDLLDAWPYLTRLHTTMSPHEMTVDPTFQPAPDLGDVRRGLQATNREFCDEEQSTHIYTVPFEEQRRLVCLSDTRFEWPAQLQQYPALRIEQIPPLGPAQVLEDFEPAILAAHASYQAGAECGLEPGDDDEPSSDSDDQGAMDTSPSTETHDAACACRSDGPSSSTGAAIGLLGLTSLVWRRRRRMQR